MESLSSSKVVIDNNCIISNEIINLNIFLKKNNYNLIEGAVYSPDKHIIKNACIEIVEIDKRTLEEILLGYCFTNEYGRYGYTLNIKENCYYVFNVYSPL